MNHLVCLLDAHYINLNIKFLLKTNVPWEWSHEFHSLCLCLLIYFILIKFIEEAENVQMLTHDVRPRTKTDSNRSHG